MDFSPRVRRFALLGILVSVAGCSHQGISGGTPGRLTADSRPLGQMQVIVHQSGESGYQAIGTGYTTADGSFHLVVPDAGGPLTLPPGDYRWTIESVGAELSIPEKFTDPDLSPLATQWNGDGIVELVVSGLKPLAVQRR